MKFSAPFTYLAILALSATKTQANNWANLQRPLNDREIIEYGRWAMEVNQDSYFESKARVEDMDASHVFDISTDFDSVDTAIVARKWDAVFVSFRGTKFDNAVDVAQFALPGTTDINGCTIQESLAQGAMRLSDREQFVIVN